MWSLSGCLVLAIPLLYAHLAAAALARALSSYSRSRLEELFEKHKVPHWSDQVDHLGDRTQRAAILLEVLTGLALAGLLALGVRNLSWEYVALGILVSLFFVALTRLLAEALGRVDAEVIIKGFWRFTPALRAAARPFLAVLDVLESFESRRPHRRDSTPRPASVEVELHHSGAMEVLDQTGELDVPDATRNAIERLIDLGRRRVDELMTPRPGMLVLQASTSLQDAARAFVDSGFSRIPIFGEHRDDIIGVLFAKDLFAALLDPASSQRIDLRALVRPPMLVPDSKNAAQLLDEIRDRRVQMAIVLDEYGGVAGLITLEDLLEQIVGEIDDEHDHPDLEEPIIAREDSHYEVDASVTIEDLNQQLDLRLPLDQDYTTLGGLAFSTLGFLPKEGTRFLHGKIAFTILKVEGRSIRKILVDLKPAEFWSPQDKAG